MAQSLVKKSRAIQYAKGERHWRCFPQEFRDITRTYKAR